MRGLDCAPGRAPRPVNGGAQKGQVMTTEPTITDREWRVVNGRHRPYESCRRGPATTLGSLLPRPRGPIFLLMRLKRIRLGPLSRLSVMASRPPSGADWVHEIKHDGYRMIVRRDGPTVRLYSRNAYDWTRRLPTIALAAERIKAKSFTIDGEAVVLGPDGLSPFEKLRRPEAARTEILYAFDLIEHDGEDLRDHPFLDRKNALAPLLRDTKVGILLNEHVAEDGPTVFEHACRLSAEGIVSKRVDGTYRSGPCPSSLDQDPQSGQLGYPAGAERELE